MISAVVPNRDGGDLLDRCLDALAAARRVTEILVVDDGSTDGSPERAEKRDGVRVLSSFDRGFAAAANAGVAASAHGLVLLLNSDAFVRPETAERLAESLAERPRLGLCAAGLLHEDGSRAKTHDRCLTLMRALRETVSLHYAPVERRGGVQAVSYVPLACALVRRAAWNDAGGLDERFRFYYEDHDLAWRLARSGWELAVRWDAEAVHVEGGSSRARDPAGWFAQYHESRVRYLRKRYPLGSLLYLAAWTPSALVHAAVWKLRGGEAWARAYLRAARP